MFWIYLFLGLLAGIAVALFCAPVIATVDTDRGHFGLRWTALLRAQYPLPGRNGSARFYLAGIPVPVQRFRRRSGGKKGRKKKSRPGVTLPRILRFLQYCGDDASLRRAVVVAGGKLAQGSLRSFGSGRRHAEISFPDPSLNGMLYGWFAATRSTDCGSMGVNFLGQNWLRIEVRFYPYRMALAGCAFLFRLPNRAILGHWLSSKTSGR